MCEDVGPDKVASSGPMPAIVGHGGDDRTVFAGVELGGTKAIAVVGRGATILDSVSIPTTTPEATLGALAAQLSTWSDRWHPAALGIASFGPIAIHRDQPEYGRMLRTPKPGWSVTDIVGPLSEALPGPHRIHTDVTAAALAEARWGAGVGQSDIIYVTIGTGIGMGVIANGQPVAGSMHPEAGHIRVRRMPGDMFAGICPFHSDCLEGLVCGPAIAARCGVPAPQLSPDDPRWVFVADAIAEAFSMLILTLAPKSIIVGGGVGLGQPHLLPLIRAEVATKLGNYLPSIDRESLDCLIVMAKLEARAGPLGSLILAQIARADGDQKNR